MEPLVDGRQLISEKALLNEYKGNLFEYLVAHEYSKIFNFESNFISSINDQFRAMFSIQERFIRERYPKMIQDLPLMAKQMAETIVKNCELNSPSNIALVGKSNNGFSHNDSLAGADFVISSPDRTVGVSLKISKSSAFVNTKSAGIMSFIDKYFDISESKIIQEQFNYELKNEFVQVSQRLHDIYEVEFDENFSNWRAAGLPELPGALNENASKELHKFYNFMAIKLQAILFKSYSENPNDFVKALMPLTGKSDADQLLAICFYKEEKGHHISKTMYCSHSNRAVAIKSFAPEATNTSSFEINLEDQILQIRIKPMNKFTSCAFKINCSVKYFLN